MKLATTSEYHFTRYHDGVYTDSVYPYAYWARMLAHVGSVNVVARVAQHGGEPAPSTAHRVDGDRVGVIDIDDFVGLGNMARDLPTIVRTLADVVDAHDGFLLRAPGTLSMALWSLLVARRKPFAAEIVGDPWDSLRDVSPLASLLRLPFAAQLRALAYTARATRYVTQHTLQKRYPPAPGTFTVGVSDVEIPDELLTRALPVTRDDDVLRLIFVGSLARAYKGLDVLIEALTRTQLPHRLTVIGDGALRTSLQQQALVLDDRVNFLGALPAGEPILAALAAHDLFVLPSRAEGLPRVVVEAMAVGLPCIATPVGGTAELLGDEQLVAVDDPIALASRIDRLGRDPATRNRLAQSNRLAVGDFCRTRRDEKFSSFFNQIANISHASL